MGETVKARAKDMLTELARVYPNIWQKVDSARSLKELNCSAWSDWCFLPIAIADKILTTEYGQSPQSAAADAGVIACLAAWRISQGIYRFDDDLFSEITNTPFSGEIPTDVLYRLPELCVYVEIPESCDFQSENCGKVYGFFSYVDGYQGEDFLCITIDGERARQTIGVAIGPWTLSEAIDRAHGCSIASYKEAGLQYSEYDAAISTSDLVADALSPFINLILYLCSDSAEIGPTERRPGHPIPKRTKKGLRYFPPEKPAEWNVGVRIGAALRLSQSAHEKGFDDPLGAGRSRPRPHVRRAHWHGYWRGPRDPERVDERHYELRWIPPLAINVDNYELLPATIRPVKP